MPPPGKKLNPYPINQKIIGPEFPLSKFRISNREYIGFLTLMPSLKIERLPPCMGRTLIIGDVHGCHVELLKLLKQFDPQKEDRIISVGDLINRGPDSGKVLQIAREYGILPVLGNHEIRLLKAQKSGKWGRLKRRDRITCMAMKQSDWEWMETWPHVISIKSLNALVVHGGFLPDLKWKDQKPRIVTRIQVIDDKGKAAKRSEIQNGKAWASTWTGPKHVFYGHTPRESALLHQKATGLDTGCVYGNTLTAVSHPEFKFYKIRARRSYIDG